MAYNNNYDNTFSMSSFFEKNYGMPNKPKAPVLAEAWKKRGCLLTILLIWIWLPLFIIITVKNNKETKAYQEALDAWNAAFKFRQTNWPAEFDKAVAETERKMDLKGDGLKKCDIEDEDLAKAVDENGKTLEPFYIYGNLLKEGFWRSYTDGTYRCSMRKYTYFFYTEKRLYIYTRVLDLLNPTKKTEEGEGFSFKKISKISTKSETIETSKNLDGSADKVETVEVEGFALRIDGETMSYAYTPSDITAANIKNMKKRIEKAQDDD